MVMVRAVDVDLSVLTVGDIRRFEQDPEKINEYVDGLRVAEALLARAE